MIVSVVIIVVIVIVVIIYSNGSTIPCKGEHRRKGRRNRSERENEKMVGICIERAHMRIAIGVRERTKRW